MYCPKCQAENEDSARFCRNCGIKLHYTQEVLKAKTDVSSKLIITTIIIVFICSLAQFLIHEMVSNWYNLPVKYIAGILIILTNLSLILLVLAIKNKTLKIIGIVIASILIIYWVYNMVVFMIR